MKLKLTGSTTAVMAIFVISTSLAGVLGVRQYERLTSHLAWVAKDRLAPGMILNQSMLEQQRIDGDGEGALTLNQLVGKQLKQAKTEGEPIAASDIQRPPRSWLSQKVPPGRVLYTLTPRVSAIPASQLKGGDVFDVLATGPGGVRTLARNVRLMGVMKSRKAGAEVPAGPLAALAGSDGQKNMAGSKVMVIAVMPEEIYSLASIHPAEAVSLVLHGVAAAGASEPVALRPPATHRAIELVFGSNRQRVKVEF